MHDRYQQRISDNLFLHQIGFFQRHLKKDLNQLVEYYGKIINIEIKNEDSSYSQGLFYIESQLEDFIINNWQSTELGKKYDLIYENGDLISKKYKLKIF